jgi:hypothetical protein
MSPLTLIRYGIRLAGRCAVWLLDATDNPDRAPWDRYSALYVPEDAEDFIRTAAFGEGPA